MFPLYNAKFCITAVSTTWRQIGDNLETNWRQFGDNLETEVETIVETQRILSPRRGHKMGTSPDYFEGSHL